MPEQTIVKPDGTQVRMRTPDVTPNVHEACQAMVTTQVIMCEPMSDKSWRLVTSFTDNYNIVLEERDTQAAQAELLSRLREVKEKWDNKRRIISLENLLNIEQPSSLTKEANSSSSAPSVPPN